MEVENLRRVLMNNYSKVPVKDFKTGKTTVKKVSSIVKRSSSPPKFSSFLTKLADFLKCTVILETGTSLGLNTLYLAASDAKKVITLEGNSEIAGLARENFKRLGSQKIHSKTGTVQENFSELIKEYIPDLIFLDADHRSSVTEDCLRILRPFFKHIKAIVIHDIYWSQDMCSGWNRIKKDPELPLTLDIFQAGIIFPNIEMEKQHFVLKF